MKIVNDRIMQFKSGGVEDITDLLRKENIEMCCPVCSNRLVVPVDVITNTSSRLIEDINRDFRDFKLYMTKVLKEAPIINLDELQKDHDNLRCKYLELKEELLTCSEHMKPYVAEELGAVRGQLMVMTNILKKNKYVEVVK